MRPLLTSLLLITVTAINVLLALASGSYEISMEQLGRVLAGSETGLASEIIFDLRLPRVLAAFVTGALLSMAGVYIQTLLNNPLADPYILGISGGAAVATLAAILAGASAALLPALGFLGAIFSMLLVFSLSRGIGSGSSQRLLLTGVVLATGWGALMSLLLSLSSEQKLRGMLYWLMGDLSNSSTPVWAIFFLVISFAVGMGCTRSLNLFAKGELEATVLGVPAGLLKTTVFLLTSLTTATAVTIAGTVGFIGLITPHMVRLLFGADHRILLPVATVLGGNFLLLADSISRTCFSPIQLPVGVFTALIGVPLFLYLLYRSRV